MTKPSVPRRIAHTRASLIAGLALLGLFASACSGSGPAADAPPAAPTPTVVNETGAVASTSAATQTSEGGQVTVTVTWQANQQAAVFKVALNTHSVDLDAVDLSQTAVLRTDQGLEVRPKGWDAPRGGHHRSGTLTFPATAPNGTPVLGESTRSFELLIRDVAGVPERRFEWDL